MTRQTGQAPGLRLLPTTPRKDYQMKTLNEAKHDMCVNAVARVNVLGLKGVKREAEAMAFCTGYATALINNGGPDLSAFVGLVVAFRGMKGIEAVAEEATTEG